MARLRSLRGLRAAAQRMFVIAFMLGLVGPLTTSAHAGTPTAEALPDSYEGVYDMRGARMLDGTQKIFHMLVDGPNETELILPEGMELPRGARIKADGLRQQSGELQVQDFEVLVPAPIPTIDPEPRPPRRIATIIVFWDSQGINNAGARDSMFLDAKSTNVFYGENSYGMDMMAGNVFGPYQIDPPSGCNSSYIASAAMAAFKEKGHDEKDYRQFMYHFGGGLGCGWSGLGSIGTPDEPARDSWYNNTFGCVVRNQELAHNYGLFHSRAFVCDNGDNSTCLPPTSAGGNYPTNLEYGDPWTPLGNGCHHMTAPEKMRMGYLEGCNIVTASDSGTFNLLPTELPCNGTQMLRLPTTDGRNYVLEYRRSLGSFDIGLEGVLLHVSNASGSSNWWVNVGDVGRLHQGDSFADPDGAWSFTITEENETHAVIDVQFASGNGQAPTCADGAGAPGMEAGNIGILECAAEPFPLDTEPPTVAITYPAHNEYFEPGASFTITAEAMDDRQVTELELYADGQPVFKVFSNPGEWEVNNIPKGIYEFGVVASDGPNFGLSEGIRIYVGEDPPGGVGSTGGDTDTGTTTATSGTTGDTDTDTDTDGTGTNTEKGGCACSTSATDPAGAAWLLGLGVVGVRIRRRR